MKKISKIKHFLVLGLIFLMSINSFATSVSDNDGSAFITKAEFDALKSSFQAQIDMYNQNIDSKIDEAIASYLAGITIAKEIDRNTLFNFGDVLCMDPAKPLRYGLGYSYIEGLTGQSIYQNNGNPTKYNGTQNRLLSIGGNYDYWGADTNSHPFKKLLVKNIDTTKHIAEWAGYSFDGREHVGLGVRQSIRSDSWWSPVAEGTFDALYDKLSIHASNIYDNEYNVTGPAWTTFNSNSYFWRKNWSDADYNGHQGFIYIEAFEAKNPKIEYENLFVFNNANVWELQSADAVTNTAYTTNSNGTSQNWKKKLRETNSECNLSTTEFIDWMNASACNTQLFFTQVNFLASPSTVMQQITDETWDGRHMPTASTYYNFPLVQGFESHNTPAIDNWKKVYNSVYDSLATEYASMTAVPNAVLTGKDSKKHMALTAGLPLLKMSKGETFTYKINEKGTFHNLRLWAKAYPFDVTNTPSAEADKSKFLILSGDKGASWNDTDKYLKIISNDTTVNFELPSSVTSDCYVWLKWCADDSSTLSGDEHGIELNLGRTAHVKLKG